MQQPLLSSLVALILLVAVHAPQPHRETAAGFSPEVGGGMQPLVVTSELVVGQNRFAFGLLKVHRPLEGASGRSSAPQRGRLRWLIDAPRGCAVGLRGGGRILAIAWAGDHAVYAVQD